VKYDDETLMAYADGELDAAQRAQIDAAIAQDPGLALRVQEHKALRARMTGAFSRVLDQPIPERLEAAARLGTRADAPARGNVIRFPARSARAPSPPWRAREWIAMTASLLLGVLLSWRLLVPANSALFEAGEGGLLARGELARALENQLASEQSGGERVLIGLTFKAHDGNYCRSFVLRAARTAGLACRVGSEWQVPATDSSLVSEGGMQQANSALPPSILRIIEARMEGTALDAEGEKNARLGTWAPGS
jgi:hypothetical protein